MDFGAVSVPWRDWELRSKLQFGQFGGYLSTILKIDDSSAVSFNKLIESLIHGGKTSFNTFLISDRNLGSLLNKSKTNNHSSTDIAFLKQFIWSLLTTFGTYLKPYNMTFVPALILQHNKGIIPIVGDRCLLSKNIAQMHIIAYGVHANIHTNISLTIILANVTSSMA